MKKTKLFAVYMMPMLLSLQVFAATRTINLELDSKIWSYYPPGALKPAGVLPIGKSDGVIIKNIKNKNNRLVYLVHEEPLTTTFEEYCNQYLKFNTTENLEKNTKSCLITSKAEKGFRSYQLVFSNYKKLKLVNITTQVPINKHKEVMSDYQIFRKGI